MNKYQDALNRLKSKTNKPIFDYFVDKQGLNRSRIMSYENEDCDLLQELVDKYKEECEEVPKQEFGDFVRDLMEYLIEHMYENGVSESQEVSYLENGIEFKLTFEMIEKEAGADNEL